MVAISQGQDTEYDYIIAGGGLAGCVIASRLAEAKPPFKVLLIEAGSDEHDNPAVTTPLACATMHGTPLQWNYESTPQQHLNGRRIDLFAGKLLSGSSGVNYGLWTRGHSADWDLWSKIVHDEEWSYDKMLPYFRKTETYHDSNADPDQHGYHGPIHTQGGGTKYPLRNVVRKMWKYAGVPTKADHNDGIDFDLGNPLGCAVYTENWHKGARQPAGVAYNLANVHVMTNSRVDRIIIEESTKSVKGIELDNERRMFASKEVIVCCGAMRSPQLLMLSGIGPVDQLERLNIRLLHDNPEVGANLHDHSAIVQFWKLKNPELGHSLGHALLDRPEYAAGMPMEWLVTASAPAEDWNTAARKENYPPEPIRGPRANIESFMAYVPLRSVTDDLQHIPLDGSHISSASVCLLPKARGHLSLSTANAADMPLVDPNYCGAEADMVAIRAAMRLAMRAIESPEAVQLVEGETIADGWDRLTSDSSDAELDRRIRDCTMSFWHIAGTLSMGTVVDTDCRVKGVSNLRVVDASILPVPLSCHYQAPMYAIAERAADLILTGN